jgi:hypothetical protein
MPSTEIASYKPVLIPRKRADYFRVAVNCRNQPSMVSLPPVRAVEDFRWLGSCGMIFNLNSIPLSFS